MYIFIYTSTAIHKLDCLICYQKETFTRHYRPAKLTWLLLPLLLDQYIYSTRKYIKATIITHMPFLLISTRHNSLAVILLIYTMFHHLSAFWCGAGWFPSEVEHRQNVFGQIRLIWATGNQNLNSFWSSTSKCKK